MGWHCPKCNFMVEDGAFQCMACGYHQETRLILTSGVGNKWRTLISAEITRRTYKRLYPDTEHQYIPRNEGEHPFSVIKDAENNWFLQVNGKSPVAVTLNGNLCDPAREYLLNNGDSISIASRSDSSRQVAPLTVSFILKDAV
ncbi:hypothetical protein [Fibrobacter sp. UWB7]|uniref:hypothetical protein n=1 Tax=Fibrobacter sp. UWB7 TaxID=1896206 RepID=UPI0009198C53|nr:hypothetical protein [Fibrobacter sp. UWB7]SHN01835.1 hypothetical protein SAMN05720467_3088 [Fibrobacter sp. UWB7]